MRASELSRLPAAASWLSESGPEADVVLASRVRLARNLSDHPYPNAASSTEQEAYDRHLLAAVREELSPHPFGADTLEFVPAELSQTDQQFLRERSLADDTPPVRLIVTADERLSVAIGSEDHLRIASMLPGLALSSALEQARSVDRSLEGRINYAFAMDWGYLSAEITNLGTALRASVLVHLPALSRLGRLEAMSASMENSGYELIPFFPEEVFGGVAEPAEHTVPSTGRASLCLLRNRRTLGSDEDALVAKLEEYTTKLVHYERAGRDELRMAQGEEIADSANRALGILRFARSLSALEARSLVSHLRLGIVAGLVSDVTAETVTTLLLINQDSHVARSLAQEGDGNEVDVVRARVFRDALGT